MGRGEVITPLVPLYVVVPMSLWPWSFGCRSVRLSHAGQSSRLPVLSPLVEMLDRVVCRLLPSCRHVETSRRRIPHKHLSVAPVVFRNGPSVKTKYSSLFPLKYPALYGGGAFIKWVLVIPVLVHQAVDGTDIDKFAAAAGFKYPLQLS